MGALISAGSGLLTKLMGPGKPYKNAAKTLTQEYNKGQQYLQPYQEQGQEAYPQLNTAFQNLLNPVDLRNQWNEQYEMTPEQQNMINMATEQGQNTAQALGIGGTTPALQAIQSGASGMANRFKQDLFKDFLNMYEHGANLGQNIFGTGANAAGQMSNNAANYGQNLANLMYGKSAAPNELFSNLVGNFGSIAANYPNFKGAGNMGNYGGGNTGNNSMYPNNWNSSNPAEFFNPGGWSTTGGR